jgi:glycosyltransferase involved in cell wall biosynthesis
MKSNPLLSFCIPTYNRRVRVTALVESILSLPDDDIEVVVLDNGSTDGTYDSLLKITDPRLKLRSNGENRGALFNMVHVFNDASGEFVVYSTDQDTTHPERVAAFKIFLRTHPRLSCGFCGFDLPDGLAHQYFPSGIDAVTAIAYRGRHPTGYFFRNNVLRQSHISERFVDFDKVHLFPLEFAFAEAALSGDGAIYNAPLFSPNQGDDVVKHKSATTNGASKNAFFAPVARLKLAVSYSEHVETLALSKQEKAKLIANLFIGELRAATVGYRAVMGNEQLCIHYRMSPRRVSNGEMVRIAFTFCCEYVKARFTCQPIHVVSFLGVLFFAVSSKALRHFKRRKPA